ncbi:MAG TPA: hypothetical protein VE735_04230 [Gammaproteobacteria bacterium]|nr:hypothetical protein [Gammaproteobacteria bacterium]
MLDLPAFPKHPGRREPVSMHRGRPDPDRAFGELRPVWTALTREAPALAPSQAGEYVI